MSRHSLSGGGAATGTVEPAHGCSSSPPIVHWAVKARGELLLEDEDLPPYSGAMLALNPKAGPAGTGGGKGREGAQEKELHKAFSEGDERSLERLTEAWSVSAPSQAPGGVCIHNAFWGQPEGSKEPLHDPEVVFQA